MNRLSSEAGGFRSLLGLFRENRGRLICAYGLFHVENLMYLVQPMVLGWTINDLLSGSLGGFAFLLAHRLVYTACAAVRRLYDAYAFTAMSAELATTLVLSQRTRGIDPSRVAARVALSRLVVEFLERDLPAMLRAAYSLIGALVLLACYDVMLVPVCAVLTLLAGLLCRTYGVRNRELYRGLHNDLEQEVGVIRGDTAHDVHAHFGKLARWRRQLSNAEAGMFAGMELVAVLALSAVLIRATANNEGDAGRISAVVGYTVMFVVGLTNLPVLADLRGRLLDVCNRLDNRSESAAAE